MASKKHENKENVDTESPLSIESTFALPAPNSPFAKRQIETQLQTIPFQAPVFKGRLHLTNENLEHTCCLGITVNSNMNTMLVSGRLNFFPVFTSLVGLVTLVRCCKRFNRTSRHVTCMLIAEVVA